MKIAILDDYQDQALVDVPKRTAALDVYDQEPTGLVTGIRG